MATSAGMQGLFGENLKIASLYTLQVLAPENGNDSRTGCHTRHKIGTAESHFVHGPFITAMIAL